MCTANGQDSPANRRMLSVKIQKTIATPSLFPVLELEFAVLSCSVVINETQVTRFH